VCLCSWAQAARALAGWWLNEAPAEHHRRIVYRLTLGLIVSTVVFARYGKSDLAHQTAVA
jgi:hypothetical protein